jgi:hypothetical protein
MSSVITGHGVPRRGPQPEKIDESRKISTKSH